MQIKDRELITLKAEQGKFSEQKSKIDYLEDRINELSNLNKEKTEKIFQVLSRLLPEKELLGQLIKAHLEFTRYKEQATAAEDYNDISEEYEDQIRDTKKKLKAKLTKEQMNKIRNVLKDFEKLVIQELELEQKLTEKQCLINDHKTTALQINSAETQKIVAVEEETQEQQIIKFKQQRTNSVVAEISF